MDSAAQLRPAGLAACPVPDLRGVPLAELARLADDGDDVIHGVVTRMIDGEEKPSHVPATIFNSAI